MSRAGVAYLAFLFAIARVSSADTIRHLRLFGWHLQLEENPAIQSPHYKECNYYKGRVLDVEVSSAMVTECDGQWYGLLQIGEEIFVLPPRKDEKETHLMRKRDLFLALIPQKVPVYNLTHDIDHDSVLDLEDDLPPLKAPIRTRSSQATHEDFFRKEPSLLRPSSRLWLEIAIVADHTMLKFHGDKVQPYILALMNIVSAIFNDRSLGANMTIVINTLFLRPEAGVKYADTGISESLKRVNKWNKRHLLKIPTESGRWDALVWLTRSHLGGPSGLARLNGVCSLNSATLQRDEGFTTAFVIAHELGHLLGLHHDDSCDSKTSANTIMANVVRASLEFSWSSCSRNQFHIKSRKWKCLHERSTADGLELGRPSKHSYVFSLDHQCRVEFGEGFSVCKEKMDASICSVLYCAHQSSPSACVSKNSPPLEGTICKKDHWCSKGECSPILSAAEKHQWEPWVHGSCRADCDYGLRVSKRRCRNNENSEPCHGQNAKVSPCWSGTRCTSARDVRAELCARLLPHYLPYVDDDLSKRCHLHCVNTMSGAVSSFGSLPDSTSCSYERPYDVCYKGVCLEGHCNSSDRGCNWCPLGHCRNYTHTGLRHLRKGWAKLVEISPEVHRFIVHIPLSLPLEIGIRSHTSPEVYNLRNHSKRSTFDKPDPYNYFKYDVSMPQSLRIVELGEKVTDFNEVDRYRLEGRLVVAGTVVKWKETDSDVFISGETQPSSSITILVAPDSPHVIGEQLNFSLNYSESYSTSTIRPMENRRSVRRGPCSVSCGGGTRLVRHRCLRGQTCKPIMYEPCNLHRCEFTWAPAEWEDCSQTCGDHGVQERQIFCVPQGVRLSSRTDLIRNSVSPTLCSSKQLTREQPCNRIPCPVYWQELDWTECSTTCGPGEQYRPLICPAAESFCGPRPTLRRRRCRSRRCPPPAPSEENRIQSCDLMMPELMKGYCKILYFRKQCGRTCREIADTT